VTGREANTSPAAKDLFAKIQKDRADKQAARKADAEARAKQRDEAKGARDQVRANKNLPREQFRALVSGRTEQQVLEALGKPDETPGLTHLEVVTR
jgi:hypothetical protein